MRPLDRLGSGDQSIIRSRFFAFFRAASALRFRLTLGFS
jgi:hypothetical protein